MPLRPSQRRGPWLALAIALCCRHGAATVPSDLHLSLEYGADAVLGCPSAAELSASIAAQLGYDPFTSADAEQRLRVEITKVGEQAEARIEWIGRQQHSEGERRLSADGGDCATLARSVAFAVAVQIQLHASLGAPAPAPAPPAAPPSSPAPPAKPAMKRESAPAHRLVLLGVGAMLRHGLAPGVTPGLRVFGTLSKESWSFELSAHATLPGELKFADATGFTAHELGANLAPCLRLAPFGFCAVGTLSLLRVRGQGVDHIGSPSSLTGGLGTRLQLLWPALERFGVLVQGEALAVLGPRDVILNETKVWSSAPVAFTVMLDFAAIFP
jgi:hypothetical protein